MRKLIQARIQALGAEPNSHMQKTHGRYKADYDLQVRVRQCFKLDEYLFVTNPTLISTPEGNADVMSKHPYNKIHAQSARPYRIAAVQRNTETIIGKGIPETLRIDLVTHALKPQSYSEKKRGVHKELSTANGNDSPNELEYVVDKII